MTTEIEHCEQIIAGLSDKHDRAKARVLQIAEERKSLGYAAHVEQDAKAIKQLAALNHDAIALDGEIESIEAAIAEAKKHRLAQARGVANVEQD